MNRILIVTPYTASSHHEVARNVRYARACMVDSIRRGEAPFAPHLIFTQPGVLRDGVPEERQLGMDIGKRWMGVVNTIAVYTDLGISVGMADEVKHATEVLGIKIDYRELGAGWDSTSASGSLFPDEVEVTVDSQDRIDEVVASSAHFHMERMDEHWFWFAVGDSHFAVSGGPDGVKVEYSADAAPSWNPDEDGCDPLHAELTEFDAQGAVRLVHKVRPCPNPDCLQPLNLALSGRGEFDYVFCRGCGMRGPVTDGHMEDSVAGWNDLPRRVSWRIPREDP